jgi:hypothetical protein
MSVRHVVVGAGCLALVGAMAAAQPPESQRRAEAIVKRAEEASLREFAPAFRASLLRSLLALRLEELEAQETREPAEGLGPVALGDSSTQLVYTPVPPCRVVDTRLAGGPLQPGLIRNFRVTGSGLDTQGGAAAGCNVPLGPATAAVINFVAVNPSGAGNLRAWAYSTPPVGPPGSSIINYTTVPGATLNLANGIVVEICDLAQTSCAGQDLRVQADVSATQLVADVVGYFERFPRELIHSFTVVDNAATDTVIGSSCTHVTGSQVTLTAPAAGKIVVRAMATHDIDQVSGGDDRVLVLGIGINPTDCGFTSYAHSKVMNATFDETFLFTSSVAATYDVVPGTYTYYLNGFMPIGPNNATVLGQSLIEATFYPN